MSRARGPVALILHQSADPDAVGSAAALAELLASKAGCTCSLFAESLNRSAKKVAESFNLDFTPAEELANHTTLVLVDLNNLEQVGTLVEHFPPASNRTVFCIDHHILHPDLHQLAHFLLHDDRIRATAELVMRLWDASGLEMPPHVATLLACGIVYDTRHFAIAVNSTFDHLVKLLHQGADYTQVLNLLSTPLDRSERIARLKAAQRVAVYDEFGLLIAVTRISSYEASVCRALIGLGADIAIACAVKEDEVRLSARCTTLVAQEYGLDLARHVMEPLGEMIGGAGGGHPTAAGANGTADSDHALGMALQLLRKELKARQETSSQDTGRQSG